MVSNTTMMTVLAYTDKHEFTVTDVLVIAGIVIISLIYGFVMELLDNRKEKK